MRLEYRISPNDMNNVDLIEEIRRYLERTISKLVSIGLHETSDVICEEQRNPCSVITASLTE